MKEKLAFSRRFITALEYAAISHLSNVKLGKLFGVSGTTIFGYRNGEKLPSIAKMITIANHCRISILWLAQGHGDMQLVDAQLPSSVGVKEELQHYSIQDKSPVEILEYLAKRLDSYLSPSQVMGIVREMINNKVHEREIETLEVFWCEKLGINRRTEL